MSLQVKTSRMAPELEQTVDSEADFETMLRESMDELMAKTRLLQTGWNFGDERDWSMDQATGELMFVFPELLVSAPAQVVGTLAAEQGSWTWAWADASLPAALQADALVIKAWGEHQGLERLTAEKWHGDENDAWYMAALACQLCEAHGAYRGPVGGLYRFMTFGEPKLTSLVLDREVFVGRIVRHAIANFSACLNNLQEQKAVSCRYFRRGTCAGLSQAELIDLLALSVPSVLDQAGYSPESADQLMSLVGQLSEAEIQSGGA